MCRYNKTKTGFQTAGQKTGAAFSSFGTAVSKKLGEVRESTAFKSFEEKVSTTATTLKVCWEGGGEWGCCSLLYPPTSTAGGYFGFSSVPLPRHILVCALTAAFLDGFLSIFSWRCILVKSTRLTFLVMLSPVFHLL